MARGPTTFRQRDATAAIKAARAAGLEVARVEIGKDGKIVIITGKSEQPRVDDRNEWDGAV